MEKVKSAVFPATSSVSQISAINLSPFASPLSPESLLALLNNLDLSQDNYELSDENLRQVLSMGKIEIFLAILTKINLNEKSVFRNLKEAIINSFDFIDALSQIHDEILFKDILRVNIAFFMDEFIKAKVPETVVVFLLEYKLLKMLVEEALLMNRLDFLEQLSVVLAKPTDVQLLKELCLASAAQYGEKIEQLIRELNLKILALEQKKYIPKAYKILKLAMKNNESNLYETLFASLELEYKDKLIFLAIEKGRKEIVELLIEDIFDKEIMRLISKKALLVALNPQANMEIVKLVVKHSKYLDFSPNANDEVLLSQVMKQALQLEDHEAVKALRILGAQPLSVQAASNIFIKFLEEDRRPVKELVVLYVAILPEVQDVSVPEKLTEALGLKLLALAAAVPSSALVNELVKGCKEHLNFSKNADAEKLLQKAIEENNTVLAFALLKLNANLEIEAARKCFIQCLKESPRPVRKLAALYIVISPETEAVPAPEKLTEALGLKLLALAAAVPSSALVNELVKGCKEHLNFSKNADAEKLLQKAIGESNVALVCALLKLNANLETAVAENHLQNLEGSNDPAQKNIRRMLAISSYGWKVAQEKDSWWTSWFNIGFFKANKIEVANKLKIKVLASAGEEIVLTEVECKPEIKQGRLEGVCRIIAAPGA